MRDFIIGNPPFLGGKLLINYLGEDYVDGLFSVYRDRVPAEVDLVCYWFAKARDQISAKKSDQVGLVATNSIRGGANRRVLDRVREIGAIFEAWDDEAWIVEGAAVRVSLVCFGYKEDWTGKTAHLDGEAVEEIFSDLTARRGTVGVDLTKATRLPENAGRAFMGDTKGGLSTSPVTSREHGCAPRPIRMVALTRTCSGRG